MTLLLIYQNNYNGTAQVSVYAKNTLSSTKPTATGKLSVAIKSADGLIHTVTTAINSKDDIPVASSVAFTANRAISTTAAASNVYASPSIDDIDVSGNNITMYSKLTSNADVNDHLVSKYSPDGNTASDSLVYLYADDQYGTQTAPITTLNASGVDASGNAISGLRLLTVFLLLHSISNRRCCNYYWCNIKRINRVCKYYIKITNSKLSHTSLAKG